MSARARCHCGRVEIDLPSLPDWAAACNCSICAKLGWLVAYYPEDSITIRGETHRYERGEKLIAFHFCPTCGCATHWSSNGMEFGRQGINARLVEGLDLDTLEIRHFDNRSA